jgi:hypothetical protein
MKNYCVIPAQAGIQQLNKPAQRTNAWVRPTLREIFNQPDFRLRGNDGAV